MPKFAANLTTMFAEFELAERFERAHQAGFDAVELLHPYTETIDHLRTWLGESELQLVLINTAMGDARSGDRGIAAVPGRHVEFIHAVRNALSYAEALDVPMIHVMAGVLPHESKRQDYEECFVRNMRRAAEMASDSGVRLLIEPLNTQDVPGYLHVTSRHCMELLDRIGKSNVQMQFDFYHMQIMEGNLGRTLRNELHRIGHIQFSSVPGRHEPQYGEVNVDYLFGLLDELGYNGWVGCEYRAKSSTAGGLTWAHRWGISPR